MKFSQKIKTEALWLYEAQSQKIPYPSADIIIIIDDDEIQICQYDPEVTDAVKSESKDQKQNQHYYIKLQTKLIKHIHKSTLNFIRYDEYFI